MCIYRQPDQTTNRKARLRIVPTSKLNLSQLRPQVRNANKHNPRGLGALERSIQQDGWIGAITVAADGEAFDGSARIEVGVTKGFEDAIVVHSNGSQPVVNIRDDIPTASDPKAKRLGVAANRVASIDLEWDTDVLAELNDEGLLDGLWFPDELDNLLAIVPDFEPVGIDEQGRLDEKAQVQCPHCDMWFTPK